MKRDAFKRITVCYSSLPLMCVTISALAIPCKIISCNVKKSVFSSFTIILKWKRGSFYSCFFSYNSCSVALPRGAVGWPANCDYGISWPYSLFTLFYSAVLTLVMF